MIRKLLSMKIATVLLFLFAAIIGIATFIENDYGTQTARALVYNARWFEVFLFYFIVILLYNIVRYKSYKKKMSVFVFHISFLLIAIGALVTRYIGYEGIMHIREGQSSSTMVSDKKVLQLDAKSGKDIVHFEQPLLLSSMTKNSFNKTLTVDGKEVNFELLEYLPSAQKQLVDDKNGKMVLSLMVSAGGKGNPTTISEGESMDAGSFVIAFNPPPKDKYRKPSFVIYNRDGKLEVKSDFPMKTLSMLTRKEQNLTAGTNVFEKKRLYQFNGNAVVLKDIHKKAIVKYVSTALKSKGANPEMIKMKVTVNGKSKEVNLFSYSGNRGEDKRITLNGVDIILNMGAKVINLPFSLKLVDFQLERYPGSMSPSSYASEVTLTDQEDGIVEKPYRIYMNHVLDHKNYRFFQSSFDPDEKGTVLSVNHDPGTLPTYLGYLLLAIGMIWNLFDKNSRFQQLLRRAKKLQGASVAVTLFVLLSQTINIHAASLPELDANQSKIVHIYSDESIDKFGKIVLQDTRGRMKPLDTFAHEIVSKLTGKSSIYGVNPTSILLGMTVNPNFYQELNMIKIGHPKIAKELGLKESTKYAKFNDFFSENGYKLAKQISESVRKKPLEKSAYDKELVKVDERLNIAYMVYMGSLLKIYPVPHDANNKWVNPQEAIKTFPKELSAMVRMMTLYLFEGANSIQTDGNASKFNESIQLINLYQKKFGSKVLLSKNAVNMEIWYNKLGLLSKIVPIYLLVGIFLLLASFINVVKPNFSLKRIMQISWGIMIIGFGLHLIGMGMRWYIAGHAPWSNAYESIVFIAAATVVAGLVFARRSPFTLGATALLAGITMGVAHMNFVNPEITNLVPVLKSYWLMIHVATIISGDGFLGLGSILSLLVLILFIMKRKSNSKNIDRAIKELTSIAEMSLIVGLFFMTVGNFLGGVWANESWGRYWGWDSKETWAAVTILVYATVLHLRFIPKFNNAFAFNVASLWAYSSVIMTYFGVNYYLSGLHSYAAGEPVPIPSWVPYSVVALFVLTMIAARNLKNIKLALYILAPFLAFVLFIRYVVM